jgi:hypothetical protein
MAGSGVDFEAVGFVGGTRLAAGSTTIRNNTRQPKRWTPTFVVTLRFRIRIRSFRTPPVLIVEREATFVADGQRETPKGEAKLLLTGYRALTFFNTLAVTFGSCTTMQRMGTSPLGEGVVS